MSSSYCRRSTMRPIRFTGLIFWALSLPSCAQSMAQPVPAVPPQANVSQTGAPTVVTLNDAIARAKNLSPEYHAALTDKGIAREDKVQAVGALLPNVNYNAGF